jgi:hypothetical protein
MLTSAKIGKQDGDTRTRKAKLGYLNLSNVVSLFSVKIVKEVMDGLRVYFDFTLTSILLYNMERVQHDRVMRETGVKRQNEVKTDEQSDNNVFFEKSRKKNDSTLDEAKEKSETKPSINSENTAEKSTDESKGNEITKVLVYSKCQSSIFLVADLTKPYHVPVDETSCSLKSRGSQNNHVTVFGSIRPDRSIIKPEVRRELFALTSKFKILSRVSACLPVDLQVVQKKILMYC